MPYLRRAHDVANSAGLVEDAARWADNLTTAHASLGQWDEAERMNLEARRLNERAGTRTFIYNTFHRAEIAAGRGQADEARKLLRVRPAGLRRLLPRSPGTCTRSSGTSVRSARRPRWRVATLSIGARRHRAHALRAARHELPAVVSDPSHSLLRALHRCARRSSRVRRGADRRRLDPRARAGRATRCRGAHAPDGERLPSRRGSDCGACCCSTGSDRPRPMRGSCPEIASASSRLRRTVARSRRSSINTRTSIVTSLGDPLSANTAAGDAIYAR